jgi:hypothetical protein
MLSKKDTEFLVDLIKTKGECLRITRTCREGWCPIYNQCRMRNPTEEYIWNKVATEEQRIYLAKDRLLSMD